MAKTGHIYSYDNFQNVTFPAQVTATAFNGNATSATIVNGHTVETDVPLNAVFTDTIPTLTFEMDTTDTKKLKITFG